MCGVKRRACARKRIFIHDKYTWHAHYVTLSTHALLGLQNRFAVSLSAHVSSWGMRVPLSKGDVRFYTLDLAYTYDKGW